MPTPSVAWCSTPRPAPAAAPTTGTRNSAPTMKPQKAPHPVSCHLLSRLCFILGLAEPTGQETTAWSRILIKPSDSASFRIPAACSAPSGLSNFHAVKVATAPPHLPYRLPFTGSARRHSSKCCDENCLDGVQPILCLIEHDAGLRAEDVIGYLESVDHSGALHDLPPDG